MSMKKKIFAASAAVLVLVLLSPLRPYLVSLGVMSVYSNMHEKQSIMSQKNFEIDIPGGGITDEQDWYPFVMTYHAGNDFGRIQKEPDLQLTIMYNFPAFDYARGCSRLYDSGSAYYNGFYGAYVVASGDEAVSERFGFTGEGTIDISKTALVPEYDFFRLVLDDFGISPQEKVFEWQVSSAEENISYAGCDGWTRVDADLLVNGALHIKKKGVQSYLQYGSPGYEVSEAGQFSPVNMQGRVYGRYFEEYGCSIFFYILAADRDVLENCDKDILSKSSINNL